MADKAQKRGFTSMDKEKVEEIARKGGESQAKEHHPANFADDKDKTRKAGKKGGQN